MDFAMFDADQHYYEAEDCLTRFASKRMQTEKFVRWVAEMDGKRKRLFIGGRDANVIPNPTFNPIAQPGVYHETLKKLEAGNDRTAIAYGELEPIRPAYRDREVRLGVMDEQGVERTMLFPTLCVTLEGFMKDDVGLLYDSFESFNRWLEEDWGFAWKDRIYAAPYLIMLDRDRLIAELERVLKAGVRVITIRPGPAYGRSPADPYFDPFWARVEEAGVLVTYHAFEGPSEQVDAYQRLWAASPQPRGMEHRLLQGVIAGSDAAIMDTLSALVLHNLFGRFPKIRVATIELGCGWVSYLMRRIDHAGGLINRKITAFGQTLPDRPSEILKHHVWVAPFPEEDVLALAGQIGTERVLMGSDWPHVESIPHPREFVACLEGMTPADKKRIMRDNFAELLPA